MRACRADQRPPATSRRRHRRALIECVRAWAAERGLTAMTLTTFADVPWSAPLYRHLGFRVLNEDELGPQLREVRDSETAHGLDPAKRSACVWACAVERDT